MSFGENLQFLRKMHMGMTQEELAEKLNVSRQTVSKWELDSAFPEMEKALVLCKVFSCSLDELLTDNISTDDEAYSNIRIETVPQFSYIRYAVISSEPEDDAILHVTNAARAMGIEKPVIIGWDFPFLSQEQINVFHMHGYAAACVLPKDFHADGAVTQASAKYVAITIKEPFTNPFVLIPNAYKTLKRYMLLNGLSHKNSEETLPCYERTYEKNGVTYMDVYIAIAC